MEKLDIKSEQVQSELNEAIKSVQVWLKKYATYDTVAIINGSNVYGINYTISQAKVSGFNDMDKL